MSWDTSTRAARLPANWRTVIRPRILARDPLCRLQLPGICTGVSTEVDHRIPGDDHSDANLWGVCTPCHAHKTKGEAAQARWQVRERRPAERHPGLM
jgi:5-methylcytosine-specific restriction protein A